MKKQLLFLILIVGLLAAVALPAMAAGPFHGGRDLVPPKHPVYGHHPNGCTPPLVLNKYGQCALPGMNTHPDPRPHRAGF